MLFVDRQWIRIETETVFAGKLHRKHQDGGSKTKTTSTRICHRLAAYLHRHSGKQARTRLRPCHFWNHVSPTYANPALTRRSPAGSNRQHCRNIHLGAWPRRWLQTKPEVVAPAKFLGCRKGSRAKSSTKSVPRKVWLFKESWGIGRRHK